MNTIKDIEHKIATSIDISVDVDEPTYYTLFEDQQILHSEIKGYDIFTQDNKLYLRLDLMINDLTKENIIGEDSFRNSFEKLIFDFMVKNTHVRINNKEIK